MPAKWSTVRIFISSTFRDMHAERDHLVKVVFPALRERLEPYQLHLVDIDLRWGITREQAERDQVLDVCLDSIDECRPFFLGILGERYGWVPKQLPDADSKYGWTQEQTGKSVTELEILWGALLRPDLRENSIFLFRDPKFLAEMPSELRPNFAAEDEESAVKQEQLKQRIRSAGLPIDPQSYPCGFAGLRINWAIARQEMSSGEREAVEAVAKDGLIDPREYGQLDAARQELVRRYGVPYLNGLEEFGRQVLETLWKAIRIQHRLEETSLTVAAEDPFAAEDANHEAFMESRLRVYVGRDHLYELVTAAVFDNRRWPCVVSGRSGAGKSAALARFVRDFSREHPETFVIAHFIGASPESTNLRQLLRRVCAQLNRRFRLEEPLPSDIDELAALFRKLIAQVPADDRVVIVIDALDQLDEADLARGLHWLPRELPEHVSLVVSAILLADRVHRVQAELMERDCVRISMAPLTPEERRGIVQAVPSISAKTLDAAQIDQLMANPETVNPLYLLVALEELRGFGSFEQLSGRIALFPQGEDAVTALFQQVIERLEHEFDPATVKLVLASLSASRRGLSDRELLELAEGPVVKLTESRSNLFSILRQLRSYLQRRGPLIGFFHRNLDQAVRERYFASLAAQAEVHRQLADYFRHQNVFLESPEEQRKNVLALPLAPRAVNQRLIDEVPYQLLQAAKLLEEDVAWNAVAELWSNWRFLEAKAEAGPQGIFAFADDLAEAVASAPERQSRFNLLALVLEAVRRDLHFLDRHPTTLFQCLWNSGWWYDSPDAVAHYVEPTSGWTGQEPWNSTGHRLSAWLECWREEKRGELPGFRWVRALRPPPVSLGSRQKFLLGGHADQVTDIAWSPDGGEIVSVARDATIRVWNARSGLQAALLEGAPTVTHCVAWSPDGRLIAAGNKDGGIECWDAVTRTCLTTIPASDKWIYALCFTPDSQALFSAGADELVRRWNVDTFQEEYRISVKDVSVIAVSPDGLRLATGSRDRSVQLWNVADGMPISRLGRQLEENADDLQFSPDGKWLAAGTSHGARLWTLRPGAEQAVFRAVDVFDSHFALSPDGTWLAIACSKPLYEQGMNPLLFEERVRIVDTATGAERAAFQAHREGIRGIDISPDGHWIGTLASDDLVKIWNAATYECVHEIRSCESYFRAFFAMAFSPDGRSLAAVNRATIHLWNIDSGEVTFAFDELDEGVKCLMFLPDGRVVCGCDDHSIRIQSDSGTAIDQKLIGHARNVSSLAATNDGAFLASGSEDNTARIWRIADGAEIAVLRGHSETVRSVAFSPDGKLLVTGSEDKTVQLWDARTGVRLGCFPGHNSGVHTVAFHPDGTRYFSGGTSVIRVWNPEGDPNAETVVLGDDLVFANGIAISPSGASLACPAGNHHSVGIWDLKTRTLQETFAGHQEYISCLAYSPDGTLLATASNDRTVRVWSVAGKCPSAPPPVVRGDRSRCFATEVSSDGQYALAGVTLWDVQKGTPAELTCYRPTGPDGWGREEEYNPVVALRAAFYGAWDLAAVLDDLTLRTFSPRDAKQIVIAARLPREPSAIAYSPGGGAIAVIDGAVATMWSAYASPEPLGELRGHENSISCIAWSTDRRWIATGSYDLTVRLWDDSTYAEAAVFRGAERELDSVAFSPDGKFLAAGELGGVIRIWNIESRELFARLKLDSNSVSQLAFSADGTRLIARDSDDRAWEFEITASVPLRSLPGLFDLSAWAAGEAILGFHEKLESTFQDAASGHAAGWYPESLKGLAGVHGASVWSGTSGGRVHLVKLETEGEIAVATAAADVREIEEPDAGSSGGWWNNLKRRLFRS